jgi:lipoprotein-anchoring transpeptidase ErfK/SrfK
MLGTKERWSSEGYKSRLPLPQEPLTGLTARGFRDDMARKIRVNLSRQVLLASEHGKEVFAFDCTSGDSTHPTPLGVFSVQHKHKKYTSHKYKVAMDYAMFFHQGYAIHMSHAVGATSYLKYVGADYFGSHGCVRLSEADAKKLFDWTTVGTPVEIVEK